LTHISAAEQFLLHASLIEGIGPVTLGFILEHKPETVAWTDLYRFTAGDWSAYLRLGHSTAQKLVTGLADADLLAREVSLIDVHNIQLVTRLAADYPPLLLTINAPPAILYYRGALSNQRALAVIGSRKADQYAHYAVQQLVPPLVAADFTIVSGGALGADSMAHETTVRAGGSTIAVLGSGLLQPYPRENKKLFDAIADSGGAVISAFPLRTPPAPGNFPARNRIIAGMSVGCVVVQAAQKSGASITAQYALEQGREVFAVPGPIDHELSAGCHQLIQQGAKLVMNAEDILIEFGYELQRAALHAVPSNKTVSQPAPRTERQHTSAPTVEESLKTHAVTNVVLAKRLLAVCAQARTIDELLLHNDDDLGAIQQTMFELLLADLVEQDASGRWLARSL